MNPCASPSCSPGEADTETADDTYAFFGGWEAAADEHGKQQGYFERSTAKLWAAAGQALVQITVILMAVPGWGKLSAVVPLLSAGYGMLVTRRTPEASTEHARWLGFKQHIEEQLAQEAAAGTGLSGMQPDERLAYAGQYERFMIYALALGVSESEIGQMGRSIVSSDESMQTLAERHPILYYSLLHHTLFSTISQGMNDAASAAVSHLGGSSTTTGGFTGGGGGGGGGGRGAF
ncbi:DUF2207 family protein [Paenibacillus sp. 1P07SE]|uniref:DUF2207 family protein n=1 Tax=Paenibacillus sp. 1P07SE TaxID=3132209 RepID=UPI0039A74797